MTRAMRMALARLFNAMPAATLQCPLPTKLAAGIALNDILGRERYIEKSKTLSTRNITIVVLATQRLTITSGERALVLQRTLEPEVMDTPDEARDYNEMDHSEVNRVFVDDLLACGEIVGDVLDLGTGTALIPVALCERVEECRVMACDMSASMLDLAVYNLAVTAAAERIQLDQADAKQLNYEDDEFDIVISNSIVHHIPEPLVALREAVRVVKPGGLLFFRDLMRPESSNEVDDLVATYAAEANKHQRQMFDDSLRAALTLEEMRELVITLGFAPNTVRATSDRHWTWIVRKPITDSNSMS